LAKKLSVSKSINNQHSIIGLACAASDYRLLYFANKALGFCFEKRSDLPLYGKIDKLGDFSFYHFYNDERRLNFYLFSNKNQSQVAIPDYKNLDYFLLIDDLIEANLMREILNKLRSIPVLQAAMTIPSANLKDLDILLEDMELHLITIKKLKKIRLLWP